MRIVFSVLLSVLLFLGYKTSEAKVAVKITGIYSNMHFNKQSGDLAGAELFIVNTSEGFYVIFQDSEGVPLVPIVSKLKVIGDEIGFSLSSGVSFEGKVSRLGIEGKYLGGKRNWDGSEKVSFKRKHSYWE